MKRIMEYCEKLQMLAKGDGIILGLSGGADSVCLLLFLHAMQQKYQLSIKAVHVHHHIRGEDANQDALFCEKLCKQLDIPFVKIDVDVPAMAKKNGLTEEEAGRCARYDAFQTELSRMGYQKIAVAHHKQDLAETMIFHMTRGTGLNGMVAMRPVTGNIIRPLLSITRQEIESILSRHGVEYRQDVTNEDTAYSRNYIRKEIIPALEQVNTKAVEHFATLSEQLAMSRDFIANCTQMAYNDCVQRDADEYCILLNQFQNLHVCLQQEIIKKVIADVVGTMKDITNVHITDVLDLVNSQNGKRIMLPYGLEVMKAYDKLSFHLDCESLPCDWKAELLPGTKELSLPDGSWLQCEITELVSFQSATQWKKEYTKYFDCDKITNTLIVRSPEPEDYLVLDDKGHQKPLNRYFIDAKIPAHKRTSMLVLADGHLVLWVLGYRTSEHARITDKTKGILKISWIKEGIANDR